MPLLHLVTFTFHPDTTEQAVDKLDSALDGLGSGSGAVAYFHGADGRVRDGNADYAVAAVFEDRDAFSAYINSPEHLRIVRELLTPILHHREAVQLAVDSSAVAGLRRRQESEDELS